MSSKPTNKEANLLPKEKNPFKNIETLEKYGEFDGDTTGFVDGGVNDNELQK
ncbi:MULTISPECIES: hypothetical protein [Lactobacillus]|uniref:hypothetical protein n=1 Tax=Lactobacillus TaxID=1578 RepID=UPI00143E0344|nr:MULTISPECIES: hypothetical protein [Lactobacillus]